MKTKAFFFATAFFTLIVGYSQTFQKNFDVNMQQHYHDLNIEQLKGGSSDLIVSGNLFDVSMQNYTPFLKRVDVNGNVLWMKTYNTTGSQRIRFFDITTILDQVIVTGSLDVGGIKKVFIATVEATTGNLSGPPRYYEVSSPNFNSRGLTIKYTNSDVDGDLIPDPGYIVGGFVGDSYSVDINSINLGFVMRTDINLNLLWTIELNSNSAITDYDFVNNVTETVDGYFITGSSNHMVTNQQAILAHKVDFQGNFLWDRSYVFGNSRDVSVDAYYDAPSQQIYMLSNYSVSHYFGITVFDNATGTINPARTWYSGGNDLNQYGFTIMESLDNNNNNLVITGYDQDEFWIGGNGNYTGQSNLFVYEFKKATGDQVLDNFQYLVTHVEPPGDEFNFWNAQLPLIYYPDISYVYIDAAGVASNYFHIGYKTDPGINFTEANLFKTLSDKRNECDNLLLFFNHFAITKSNVNVVSAAIANTTNPFVLNDIVIPYLQADCVSTLSIEDTDIKGSSIYPNPSSGVVYTTSLEANRFTVFDSLGSVVLKGTINADRAIYLTSLKTGIYFIRIASENRKSEIFKIVKE